MENYDPKDYQGRSKKQYESTGKILTIVFGLTFLTGLLTFVYYLFN